MKYIFRQTLIWDGAKTIDENRPAKKVKAASEKKARKNLPQDLGREWILVEVKI